MNRAAFVYLVMVLVLIGGLWLVLVIGSSLEAPQDLAGRWELSPATASGWGPGMQVDQSGRFFQIFIDHGPRLDLKLIEISDRQLVLQGSNSKVIFTGLQQDEKQIRIEGPTPGDWTAKRVSRKYPSDILAKPAATTKPAAATQEAH